MPHFSNNKKLTKLNIFFSQGLNFLRLILKWQHKFKRLITVILSLKFLTQNHVYNKIKRNFFTNIFKVYFQINLTTTKIM